MSSRSQASGRPISVSGIPLDASFLTDWSSHSHCRDTCDDSISNHWSSQLPRMGCQHQLWVIPLNIPHAVMGSLGLSDFEQVGIPCATLGCLCAPKFMRLVIPLAQWDALMILAVYGWDVLVTQWHGSLVLLSEALDLPIYFHMYTIPCLPVYSLRTVQDSTRPPSHLTAIPSPPPYRPLVTLYYIRPIGRRYLVS